MLRKDRRSAGWRDPVRLGQALVAALFAAYVAVRAFAALRGGAAVRERSGPPRPTTAEMPASPSAPASPGPHEEELELEGAEEPPSPGRRRFLTALGLAAGGAGAALVGVPVVGFLLSPLFRDEPDRWRDVGPVDTFAEGATVLVEYLEPSPLAWSGPAAMTAAWLRRQGPEDFVAFSYYCTHQGCAVRWLEGAQLFICPCHGGAFYRDGSVAAGPPPEPLERLPVRLRDGRVEISTAPVPVAGTVQPGGD